MSTTSRSARGEHLREVRVRRSLVAGARSRPGPGRGRRPPPGSHRLLDRIARGGAGRSRRARRSRSSSLHDRRCPSSAATCSRASAGGRAGIAAEHLLVVAVSLELDRERSFVADLVERVEELRPRARLPSPSMQKMKSSPVHARAAEGVLEVEVHDALAPATRSGPGSWSPVITKWLGSKVTETGTASSTRWAVAASWARVPQQGSNPILTPSSSPRRQARLERRRGRSSRLPRRRVGRALLPEVRSGQRR